MLLKLAKCDFRGTGVLINVNIFDMQRNGVGECANVFVWVVMDDGYELDDG